MGSERVLHGYRLEKIIHTGRDIDIWAASTSDGRDVALKVPSQSAVLTKEIVNNLRWEAEVMQSMDHENVIELVALHDDDGIPVIVTEYFQGGNVESLRTQQKDLVDYYLHTIMVQACKGLEHVHNKGYIHMDVKPGNMLMSKSGLLKLIDFSISKKHSIAKRKIVSWFSKRRRYSRIEGTRSYVAPEVLAKKDYDQRADIYSLGITLYVLLTDKFPFTGSSTRELTLKHLKESALPLTAHNKRIGNGMNKLVLQLLEKNPQDRPESMAKILERLKEMPIYR